MRKFFLFSLFTCLCITVFSQEESDSIKYQNNLVDYGNPREYIIADIKVTGVRFLQPSHLVSISGLSKGMKIEIPGDKISQAVNKYWKYGLFSDVKILIDKIVDNKVYLEIRLKEQPRLNKLLITGLNKSELSDLKDKINLKRGTQITEDILNSTSLIIKKHFRKKGFFNVDVNMTQKEDTAGVGLVDLHIGVNKNHRVKIEKIDFEGNKAYSDRRLRRVFKKTKQKNLNPFKGSKYIEADYKKDKKKLIDFYDENGYRDAKILHDSLITLNDKRIELKLDLFEGDQYYIRSITWVGNTKYPSEFLNKVLGIKPGSLYDQKLLNKRLREDDDAITSLYMDNGYLFFTINPVETRVENDSIDLELRIYEGKQARLNNIIIKGNTKTNEHVIRRELYTRPGELFSKSDIIRSVRELASLGHFNPETITPNPIPNPANGTVDLEYKVEERSNDQLELSGGWGGYYGFMGTVGIKFTNFSVHRMFDKGAWRPVPTGDGQTLQIRVQTSGPIYQSYSMSFVEPWFGGKKPNAFSFSIYSSKQRNRGYTSVTDTTNSYFKNYGASIGLGKRLKWPDDYFSLYTELSMQQYVLNNFSTYEVSSGRYNMATLKLVLSRNSQSQPIYPRSGSSISLGVRFTPPYSLFSNKDYSTMENSEKFKWVEFHKWSFKGSWYTSLVGNLVLAVHTEFGYLGYYNKKIGSPPFEKYAVGGDGLASQYSIAGTDIIALRGYENQSLSPKKSLYSSVTNANVYDRFYFELRYPFSLNPSATIYGLVFMEGGNAWTYLSEFDPMDMKRSAGVGVRAFLPMFGLLGVDWGYGFDAPWGTSKRSGSQWHFVLGQQF